ncbi:MAG: hypothetical protein CL512_06195 [Actinobacteria bacterium]|nr:hypothetical protein [Actinomycetota bacterium]
MSCTKNWELTCVRHYSPSAKSIDVATFYFGRDLDELTPESRATNIGRMVAVSREDSIETPDIRDDVRKLPSGIISMLDLANLTEEALEAGFHIEMTSVNPGPKSGWTKLIMLADGTEKRRGLFGRTGYQKRVCYMECDSEKTMEFIPLAPEAMPKIMWARVTEIPPAILAGILAESILDSEPQQTTLDEFADLGLEDVFCLARELALPGPSWDCCF